MTADKKKKKRGHVDVVLDEDRESDYGRVAEATRILDDGQGQTGRQRQCQF